MEKQNQKPKKEHKRITLLGFFYSLCVICILSLVCLAYVLHLRNTETENRLNELENSVKTLQSSDTTNED